ncbi:MAG TPA: outer membrane beta-barrel protein [Pyrinomonadaceae bacterium]|jgi:hypothetical protein
MFKCVTVLAAGILAVLIVCSQVKAQQQDAPKVEVGGQFTTLELHTPRFTFPPNSTEPGVGGRVGYNVTDYFGVEAELNFLPRRRVFGRMTQGQFGVKAGKRWRKFGLFAKARPGFVSFGEVLTVVGQSSFTLSNGQVIVFPELDLKRRTVFSTDVGGVVEFYPARKLLVRVDVGDTLIHYRPKKIRLDEFQTLADLPSGTQHNLQVTTGVAYRFLNPRGADEAEAPAPPRGRTPRFEVGVQYTTLLINQPTFFSLFSSDKIRPPLTAKVGVGGRITFNLNDNLALEAALNYLPGEGFFSSNSTFGGDGLQGQFGVKAGRRFRRFGLFAKVRPGFLSFDHVERLVGTEIITFDSRPITIGVFRPGRKTYFETDVGGVVEFYPTRRLVTRFDVGDTIIRYRGRITQGVTISMLIRPEPDDTRHNLQFSAGIGFRF